MIKEYDNLDNLLKNAKKIKQNKRRQKLIENREKAIISKKLVTLKKDVPIKDKIDDFELKQINKDKLYSFLREMEFNRLLSSVISTYGELKFERNQVNFINKSDFSKITKKNYLLIKNENEIENWL